MSKRIYIAYGSNMNTAQMQCRCRSAKLLAKGYLKNYELNFTGNKNGNNYATIIRKEGAKTPIALWATSLEDEHRLDMYEGFPTFYRKEIIESAELEITQMYTPYVCYTAYVYIMNSSLLGVPSMSYFRGILDAYNELDIDPTPLYDAYERCSK